MRIRAAGAADAPALAALLAELGYPDDAVRVAARLEAFEREPGSVILVAEDDGAVVGLASATTMPLLHEDGRWCRLSALVVGEERRRSGAGRRLVDAVEALARDDGCRYLEVTSGERAGREAAHAFYEALGFEQVSRRYLKEL
jgi:N-acetylglutamate synthase-like GNAT family acetyltransferase